MDDLTRIEQGGPVARCAVCGGGTRGPHWVLGCACGARHRACAGCRWAWRIESHFDPCPLTDEFRLARELMDRGPDVLAMGRAEAIGWRRSQIFEQQRRRSGRA